MALGSTWGGLEGKRGEGVGEKGQIREGMDPRLDFRTWIKGKKDKAQHLYNAT